MRHLGFTTLLAALVGCAAGDDGSGDDTDTMDMVGCADDDRVRTWSPDMSTTGDGGVFTFTLASSDPGPPAKGDNTWVVELTDGSGAAIEGATLTADPTMPDHGHGTSKTPVVTEDTPGVYTITPLYLMMVGVWEVELEATLDEATDVASFFFCVEG